MWVTENICGRLFSIFYLWFSNETRKPAGPDLQQPREHNSAQSESWETFMSRHSNRNLEGHNVSEKSEKTPQKTTIYTRNNLRAILAADSEHFSIHKLEFGPKNTCQEGQEAKEHFVVKKLFGERF